MITPLLLHFSPVSSLVTPSTVCEVTVSSAFLGFTAAASFDAVDLLSSGLTSWLVLAELDAESDAASTSVYISYIFVAQAMISISFHGEQI